MGNNYSFYLLIVVTVFLMNSCSSRTFDESSELEEFISDVDNGFLKKQTVNGVHFQVRYKPRDVFVAQELGGDRTSSRIDSLRDKYKDQYYFNLSMSKNKKELLSQVSGGRQQFGALVNELAFNMEQHIVCTTKTNDTIPLLDYVYPRMYGMTSSTAMVLVYEGKDIESENEIKIKVGDLGFRTGEVQFKFDVAQLKDEPTLNF